MQGYDKHIKKYFKSVEGSKEGAIDYTDLNTYLYKSPGLIGSSSAQMEKNNLVLWLQTQHYLLVVLV